MTQQIEQLEKLIKYRDIYEISIQFWPELTAVYISKDGVELVSYGNNKHNEKNNNRNSINRAIEYLERITKK